MGGLTQQPVALVPAHAWTDQRTRWQRVRCMVSGFFGRSHVIGEVLALNLAPCGRRLKVLEVNLSGPQAKRLTEMGLYHEAEVSVLCGQKGGSLIVCIDGCRLAVSTAMAENIRVKVVA